MTAMKMRSASVAKAERRRRLLAELIGKAVPRIHEHLIVDTKTRFQVGKAAVEGDMKRGGALTGAAAEIAN